MRVFVFICSKESHFSDHHQIPLSCCPSLLLSIHLFVFPNGISVFLFCLLSSLASILPGPPWLSIRFLHFLVENRSNTFKTHTFYQVNPQVVGVATTIHHTFHRFLVYFEQSFKKWTSEFFFYSFSRDMDRLVVRPFWLTTVLAVLSFFSFIFSEILGKTTKLG